MKNSKSLFFFAGAILMLLLLFLAPFQSHAQEALGPPSGGLFSKISSWAQGSMMVTILWIASGFLASRGWTKVVKLFARRGAVVMKELGEFSADASTFLTILDDAIKEDGSIPHNSVREVLSAGKEVVGELKDVVISIKPKKKIGHLLCGDLV